MTASLARRLTLSQNLLIALSAPTLLPEDTPVHPPLAFAPLEQSLTLRERALLNRVRTQGVSRGR